MNKKKAKKLPTMKKDITNFLLSEEGKITKKNILKTGTSLITAGMLLASTQALAQTHTSNFVDTTRGGHSSHSSHTSHSSHGSHNSY